jgi:hypothetical protein
VVSPAASQTRLQATFEAIKKMSEGLATPMGEASPGRVMGRGEDVRAPRYFDGLVSDGGVEG